MSILRPTGVLFVLLSLIVGIIYPFFIGSLANTLFPDQATGSLIIRSGTVVGSRLIGQNFSDPKYFWGRPSATTPMPYNGIASGGSNLGPLNPALLDSIRIRMDALRAADPNQGQPVPVDLVTASASGLDPDISLAAARYQLPRVARLRGLPIKVVDDLLMQYVQSGEFGFLGEARVNVLLLNLALDALD